MTLQRGLLWVAVLLALSAVVHFADLEFLAGDEDDLSLEAASMSSNSESGESGQAEAWRSLLDEATQLFQSGRNDSALVVAEKALLEAKAAHGEIHSSVALVMHRLASIHQHLNMPDTEDFYFETIDLWKALPEPQPVDMAKTISNLGIFYRSLARYSEATNYLMEALEIKQQNLPPNHSSIAATLGALGSLYSQRGDYSKAEDYYLAALDIRRNCDPPDPSGLFKSLNNMASLYSNLWKRNEAVACLDEALQVAKEEDSPMAQAKVLAGLAWLYLGKDTEQSESLSLRGLAIMDSLDLPDPDLRSELLVNLGIAYRDLGRYKKALACHLRSDSLCSVLQGDWRLGPCRLYSLRYIADDYRLLGKYDTADSLLKVVLRAHEDAEGEWHPFVGETLRGIVSLCLDTGDNERGLEASKRMYRIWGRDLTAALPVLQEWEAMKKTRLKSRSADAYFTFFFNTENPSETVGRDAAEIALGTKGRISDEVFYRQSAMAETEDTEAVALFERLKGMKLDMSDLYVAGPEDGDVSRQNARLDSLNGVIRDVESQLMLRSRHLARHLNAVNVRSADVASALPENSALIEYVKVDIYEPGSDSDQWVPHYIALVVDDDSNIHVHNLGPADEVESLVDAYRAHMIRVAGQPHAPLVEDGEEYSELASGLYRVVVSPVESGIADRQTILIAPDGALNLVSFAGLVDPSGQYLVESHRIHYLSAGRDVLRRLHESEPGQGLLVMGGADFDATVKDRLAERESSQEFAQAGVGWSASRGVLPACSRLTSLRLAPLRYSQAEVNQIVDQWTGLGEEPVYSFLGPSASEDNFKLAAPGCRVIHISTHGYYDDGSCASDGERREERGFESQLLLSGLCFAGANLGGAGAKEAGCEDAILTAYEVSAMDLDGTDLVVLSACETGLGEVEEGEGVYGLRRTFLLVGARTIVCALWKVPDATTAEMMGQLYSISGASIPERIREVQLAEIERMRKEGSSDHPFSWAGFIAMGDWQ